MFTAYMGLLDIGQPKEGETLVVAAATGPVGATVGQIGKLKGCRVVGIAGGAEKCRHATDVLGFDLCLGLITKNIAQELGVSITPVREALLRLVSSSALAVAPAQAFMVPEISLESLLEINTLLDEFQQALESGVMEKILLANRAFRFEIYHYADMPTLYAMIEQLWVRLGPSLHFLYDNFKLNPRPAAR